LEPIINLIIKKTIIENIMLRNWALALNQESLSSKTAHSGCILFNTGILLLKGGMESTYTRSGAKAMPKNSPVINRASFVLLQNPNACPIKSTQRGKVRINDMKRRAPCILPA